ncbi:MAG TPA: Crp/Fnr family transcriptional regulator [Puia sp.]|nr:Crp/Fnr family transcriptional regulator [Puia sp.]
MQPKDKLYLYDAGVIKKLEENRHILISGNSVKYIYFLVKGLMKISHITDNGDEVIKFILKPGNFFGELNLFDPADTLSEVAIALEPSEVCFLKIETAKQLMSKNEPIRKFINLSISNRIRQTEKKFLSLTHDDVAERILGFLNEFVLEFGKPVEGGYKARNFLTHQDIARIIVTTRQTVTTTLGTFKKKGWIDYDNRQLSVYKFRN